MTSCAIMILNYNGAAWLRECLPSVLAAAEAASRVRAEVWVVDNASTDGSDRLCADQFSRVRFEGFSTNRGLAAYNEAALRCAAETMVLLNNDLVVDRDFLDPLLHALAGDRDAFAASAQIRSYPPGSDAAIEMEATAAEWARGVLRAGPRGAGTTGSTFYTSGGAMACRRERFLELGGFDPIYFPGYHEDVDLSWRAWKRGWRCVHAPQSVVYHAGGATMGRDSALHTLMARNEFLFHWKNLDEPDWMYRHVLWLTPRLLAAAVSGRLYMIQGFMQALRHVPEVSRQRKAAAETARLTDSQAFMRVNDEVTPVIVHRQESRHSVTDAVEGA